MDDFNTIRLKKKTLVKFKKFSKKISPSYSETLDFMIAFFEDNHLSPYDTLGFNFSTLYRTVNKRTEAIIEIIRNIEKTQLKPTKKMLESLFAEVEEKQPKFIEKTKFGVPELISDNEELTYYRDAFFKQQREFNELKHKLQNTLRNFKPIKNAFNYRYYVLKIPEVDYQELKSNIKIT